MGGGISAFVMPSPYDVSVTYLTSMLGQPVMNGLLGQGIPGEGTIFSHMMDTFNHLLLGGGLIIFAILLVVGTMNTAAEGQFLGRQWHSVWTPMRLVFGILLVVPLKTGYCIGQYIILYAILIGVHFATALWQSAIVDVFDNQATPPAPTYLNDEIKQVVGEEYLALSVPVIANIINPGTGSQIITLPVNNNYTVGSSSITSGIVQAIQTFAAQPNSLCTSLFSGLNSGSAQAPCLSAIATALLNAGYVLPTPAPFSVSNYNFLINIGTNVPTTPLIFGATGLPSSAGWSNPSPNGLVQIYGAYVYAPPSSLSPSSSGGSSSSSSTPSGSGGTTPSTAPVVNPQAVQDLNTIVTNTLPANLAVNAQFPGFCTQSMVSYNSGSISACDMAPVVQDILNFAQANAQKLLLSEIPNTGWVQGASGSSGNRPSQFSPTPVNNGPNTPNAMPYNANGIIMPHNANGLLPSGNNNPPNNAPANNVPPNGQAAANANNMFVYYIQQGGLIFPRVGYNLNDYWIPDINSQSYIDLQLNNSWWWAGSSYLVLDNAMAQNLNMVAQSIQQQLQAFSGNLNPSGANSNISYQCHGSAAFQPDTIHVTNTLTSEFCLSTGVQVTESSPDVGTVNIGGHQVYYSQNNPADNNNTILYPLSASCEPYLSGQIIPGAGNVVNYFSCVWDKLRTSTPVLIDIPYSQPDAAISNWTTLIAPFNPNSAGSVHVDISQTPALYEQLTSMPSNLEGPFAVLFVLANSSPNPNQAYNKLYPYIAQLMQVLEFDGLLSGNQVESMLPVNKALNSIFAQLVGGNTCVDNMCIGSATNAQIQATSINTVMQQVYNLGITNNEFGVIANQFSLIQQAQNVGINMILACITSMEDIYTQYSNTLQGMAANIASQASNAATSATPYIYSGLVPLIGPILQAEGQNQIAEEQLNIMSTTLITMTNISVQLMWLPLLMFILTSLFVAGVQFAILVPLMPYILFWAGQIAWLIGVLEAVVAAPLVMLGLAHPGGHEYLGHAQGAVKMLIGVMFRPVLMVIGMIVGILLTYVVIAFSAQGFHTVAAGILNAVPSADSSVQGTLACLLLFIYATFLVMAFQKCFSTIYVIPERVVEWIGGQAARAGESELQQMQSATQSTAQGAGQAGQQSLQQGLQAREQQAQKMSDLSSQTLSTSGQVAGNWAKGGTESEAAIAKTAMAIMG